MPYFVFLELRDPKIQNFLRAIAAALKPGKRVGRVHITLRGPYAEQPKAEQIRELSESLRGRGVRIRGVGTFNTPSGFAVFLRAESSVFRDLWWKPDYPSAQDRIQPHVTLFETTSRADAELVHNFLVTARISVLTHDVELSVNAQRQQELFGPAIVVHSDGRVPPRRDTFTMGRDVLARAEAVGLRIASGNLAA